MNKAEFKKLEEFKEDYYKQNWSKLILKHLRYQNPNIANAQAMSQLSIKMNPNEQIYFHVAWLKPGRTSYVIEQTSLETEVHPALKTAQGDEAQPLYDLMQILDGRDSPKLKFLDNNHNMSDRKFYVHQMLTGFRSEQVPKYSNPRHVREVRTQKHASKDVFKNVQVEDTDINFLVANQDLQAVSFEGVTDVEEEIQKLKRSVQIQMPLIKEIYVHLQGQSSKYPFLDHYTIRQHFVKKANLPMDPLDQASYHAILSKADHSSEEIEVVPRG